MLVLSRKVGERIHIGNDVFVEVRRVAGNRVTLAMHAPKNVRILRGELVEAVVSLESDDHDGHVLDDHDEEESAKDTVIIHCEAVDESCVVPRAHLNNSDAEETLRVSAK
jgi:carbon storage regulator